MKLTIKNIVTSLIFQCITIICGFIVPKLILSNYGSSVNGLVTSITQFLTYITLLEAGFGPVIKSVLYKPIANNDKKTIKKILKTSEKIFRKIAYIFIAYIIILCIVLPTILSDEFDFIFTVSLILIIAISTFAEYFFGMTYKLFLHANQKPFVTYTISAITLVLNTVTVIVLIKLGASIQIVKLAGALIFALRPLVHNIYVKKKYNINLREVKEQYEIKQKWDALSQHISYIILTNTDVIVLTFFSDIKEVSVYGIYMLIIRELGNIVASFIGGMDASFGKMLVKGEVEEVNKKFDKFVNYYYSISTIIFGSALFLIIPFIRLYTSGITDANYIRPVFCYIMLAFSFIYSLKIPYYDLVKVTGKFKETNKGAWIEAILNVSLSISLVFKYGIVGVAIGTIVSTLYRTFEIMYFSSKYILRISFVRIIKKLLLIILQIVVIYLIVNNINYGDINNYYSLILYSIIIVIISSIIIVLSRLLIKGAKKKN